MRALRPSHDNVRSVEPGVQILNSLKGSGAKARPRLLHNGLNRSGGKNSKGSAKKITKPKQDPRQSPEIGGESFTLKKIIDALR